MFGDLGLPELIVMLVVAVLVIYPVSRVCAKAGYSSWLGLLMIIPGANLLLLWFLALAKWPNQRSAVN